MKKNNYKLLKIFHEAQKQLNELKVYKSKLQALKLRTDTFYV